MTVFIALSFIDQRNMTVFIVLTFIDQRNMTVFIVLSFIDQRDMTYICPQRQYVWPALFHIYDLRGGKYV